MRYLSLLVLLASAACSTSSSIQTATNPVASFDHYRTFSIGAPEGPPAGYETSIQSAEVQRLVAPLIAAALQRRGYALAAAKGDLVITFGSGRRQVSIHETSGISAEWLPADQNAEFVEGSLVIDAFDGSSNTRVWHGASRAHVLDRIDEPRLQKSVQGLLASFPKSGGREAEGRVSTATTSTGSP
jgi:hypothetical protein